MVRLKPQLQMATESTPDKALVCLICSHPMRSARIETPQAITGRGGWSIESARQSAASSLIKALHHHSHRQVQQ